MNHFMNKSFIRSVTQPLNRNNEIALIEQKVYQERNGQVLEDKYIKETIANGKMKIEGYENGRPIYLVKDLRKSSRKSKKKRKRVKHNKSRSKK